ncbi:MAG: hypothetical protein J3R72DRAFT_425733 [Linnemannia gamsii]|nr:MAG: hypothetical protein J3R72DRAFT_425733 [Linnemannia gamsii]
MISDENPHLSQLAPKLDNLSSVGEHRCKAWRCIARLIMCPLIAFMVLIEVFLIIMCPLCFWAGCIARVIACSQRQRPHSVRRFTAPLEVEERIVYSHLRALSSNNIDLTQPTRARKDNAQSSHNSRLLANATHLETANAIFSAIDIHTPTANVYTPKVLFTPAELQTPVDLYTSFAHLSHSVASSCFLLQTSDSFWKSTREGQVSAQYSKATPTSETTKG